MEGRSPLVGCRQYVLPTWPVVCNLGVGERKRDEEDSPAARGALDPDCPVLRLDETAADGEPEPDAPRPPSARRRAPVEGLEDALAILVRHAVTVVAHCNKDRIVVRDDVDLHLLARVRVASRVLEQVVEDLLDSERIREHLYILVG